MNFEKWKESDIDNALNSIKANTFDNVKDEDVINSFKNFQAALENEKDNLAMLQAEETGKPIKYCYAEIQRCNRIIDNAIACLIAMSVDSGLYISS